MSVLELLTYSNSLLHEVIIGTHLYGKVLTLCLQGTYAILFIQLLVTIP